MTRDCARDRCRCKTSSRSCGRTTRRTRRRCGAARGVSSPLRGTGEMWEICGDTGRFGEIWGDSDMHGTFSKLSPEPRGPFSELSRYRVTFKPMVYLRAAPATNPATRTSAFLFCTHFLFLLGARHDRRPSPCLCSFFTMFFFFLGARHERGHPLDWSYGHPHRGRRHPRHTRGAVGAPAPSCRRAVFLFLTADVLFLSLGALAPAVRVTHFFFLHALFLSLGALARAGPSVLYCFSRSCCSCF